MASALKSTRWSELDGPAKAEQFQKRGVERTARVESSSSCIFCEDPIVLGESYLDINGTRYAHKSCVISNSNSVWPAARKLITNKMREEAAQKKSAESASPANLKPTSKRGGKPKSLSEAGPNTASSSSSASDTQLPKKRGRKPKSESVKEANTLEKKNGAKTSKKAKVTRKYVRKSSMQAAKSSKAASKLGRKASIQTEKIDRSKLREEMLSRLDVAPVLKLERTMKAAPSKTAVTVPKAKRGRKPKSQTSAIPVNHKNTDISGAVVTLTITGSIEAIQETLKNLAAGLLKPGLRL